MKSRARSDLLLGAALLVSLAFFASCSRTMPLPPTATIYPPPDGGPTTVMKPAQPMIQPPPLESSTWTPPVPARDWQYIVIHHTAGEVGSVASINEEHLKKKDKNGKPWLGIGYHFVIGNGHGMPDGAIETTFRWKEQLHGAHAGSSDPKYNQVGIGVCLVGNFENHPPSPKQLAAVKRVVKTLKGAYGIPGQNVVGHKDLKSTECPGKLFPMAEVAWDDFGTQFSSLPPDATPVYQPISQTGGQAP